MSIKKNYDYLFKVLAIGDSGVGKTSIIKRFIDDTFCTQHMSTIGIDFKIKTIQNQNINDKKIKLQIWDTAGQERFRSITSAYYRGAMGIFLVYDITSEKSFDNIKIWLKSILIENPDVKKIIVGNKCDLENKRIISYEKGKKEADDNGCLFCEISAKENLNINTAFEELTNLIYKDYIKEETFKENYNLKISNKSAETKKKSFCNIL